MEVTETRQIWFCRICKATQGDEGWIARTAVACGGLPLLSRLHVLAICPLCPSSDRTYSVTPRAYLLFENSQCQEKGSTRPSSWQKVSAIVLSQSKRQYEIAVLVRKDHNWHCVWLAKIPKAALRFAKSRGQLYLHTKPFPGLASANGSLWSLGQKRRSKIYPFSLGFCDDWQLCCH